MSEQDEINLAFQFTRPIADSRKALSGGLDAFKQEATTAIGDVTDMPHVRILVAAVMEQVARSWSTAVEYTAKLKEEGEIRFFRDAEESKVTASAGDSITSLVSR